MLAFSFLSSCTVTDRRLQGSLAQTATGLPATGRKTISFRQDFRLGNFTVEDVRRGWTSTGGFGAGPFEARRVRQKYGFVLRDSAGIASRVTCGAGVSAKEIKLGKILSLGLGGEDSRELFVSNIPSRETGNWRLITQDPGQVVLFKGFYSAFTKGNTEIRVEPVHEYESKFRGAAQEILGFAFRDGIELVAAVQLTGKGRCGSRRAWRPMNGGCWEARLLYRKPDRQNSAEPQNARVKLPV
ncbi:hypothetical protein [Rufibacter ruber]|uniref:hypothetical protein n=1 Tax=Rufibacter ruber TaxID=1783499 RepID=UPI00128FD076|nr:hypothetical protein [Rufibacter ruber]